MVRYWYSWTPLILLGVVLVVSTPFLGLVALLTGSVVALAALAWAIVMVPYMLGRAIVRLWHARSGESPRAAAALSPATHQGA
jgi:hypothetical protein